MHFDPCGRNAEDVVNLIKSVTYMKYDAAKKDKDPRRMAVSFKPDFYMQILTDTLESYIENALHFTEFRLQFDHQPPITKDAFEKQINEAGRDLMRKNCKRYGVSLAKLCFDPSFEEKVIRSLEPLMDHFFAVYLLNEPGELYLLLLDECQFLKELHFRAPLLEAAEAKIAVYNQYEEKRYRISFNMEKHNLA